MLAPMKLTTISLALLLCLLGIVYAQNARPAAPQVIQSSAQVPTGNAGRYQIVMSSLARADAFLLDTQTGKVWQWTQFTDIENEPNAWVPKLRFDSDQEMYRWALTQKKKP
jgi:hypothetical protein